MEKNIKKGRKDNEVIEDNDQFEEEVNYEYVNKKDDFQKFTFDFVQPSRKYIGCVRNLMRKTFHFCNWDIDLLAESICLQEELGIFLGANSEELEQEDKEIDEDSIIAFLTIINRKILRKSKFWENVSNLFLENVSKEDEPFCLKTFDDSDYNLGILVHERVVNLPHMLVPSVYEQLLEDLRFIDGEEDYTLEEKQEYKYDYLIYFCTGYIGTVQSKKPKKGQYQEKTGVKFYKEEDDFLYKKALVRTEIPNKLGDEYKLFGLLIKYSDFISSIQNKTLFKSLNN